MKRVASLALFSLVVAAFGATAEPLRPPLSAAEQRAPIEQATSGDETSVRSDRLDPSVIDRAARKRAAPKAPTFPAERP